MNRDIGAIQKGSGLDIGAIQSGEAAGGGSSIAAIMHHYMRMKRK